MSKLQLCEFHELIPRQYIRAKWYQMLEKKVSRFKQKEKRKLQKWKWHECFCHVRDNEWRMKFVWLICNIRQNKVKNKDIPAVRWTTWWQNHAEVALMVWDGRWIASVQKFGEQCGTWDIHINERDSHTRNPTTVLEQSFMAIKKIWGKYGKGQTKQTNKHVNKRTKKKRKEMMIKKLSTFLCTTHYKLWTLTNNKAAILLSWQTYHDYSSC